MQRRERDGLLQLRQNVAIDKAMAQKSGAAMHDAMPDSRSHRKFSVGQKLADTSNGVFLAGNRRRYREKTIAGGIDCVKFGIAGSPIASASPDTSISALEGPTRYRPNFNEDEPLFSARIVPVSVDLVCALIAANANRGPPAYRRHAR